MFNLHFESDPLTLEQVKARRKLRLLDEFESIAEVLEQKRRCEVPLSIVDLRGLYVDVVGIDPVTRHLVREDLRRTLSSDD